jgi:hypothetical protein
LVLAQQAALSIKKVARLVASAPLAKGPFASR